MQDQPSNIKQDISEATVEVGNLPYDYRPTSINISDVKSTRHATLADADAYFIKIGYEVYAESAIGGRSENQDFYSAVETPYGLLLLVCDGMGGANGGAIASQLAVKTIIDSVEKYRDYTTPRELLHNVITEANLAVYQRSISDSQLSGMGTTIVALLLSDEKATVAHVGDSRIYQIRNKKRIFRTFDHSMVFELVRRGSLTEEEARLSASSNVILQALGTNQVVDNIEINDDIVYAKGDRFLLCTDGVSGAVPESRVLELVTAHKSVRSTVNNLISTINEVGVASGNEHDNLTAIVLEVKGKSKLKAKRKRLRLFIYAIITIVIIVAMVFLALTWYQSTNV